MKKEYNHWKSGAKIKIPLIIFVSMHYFQIYTQPAISIQFQIKCSSFQIG